MEEYTRNCPTCNKCYDRRERVAAILLSPATKNCIGCETDAFSVLWTPTGIGRFLTVIAGIIVRAFLLHPLLQHAIIFSL